MINSIRFPLGNKNESLDLLMLQVGKCKCRRYKRKRNYDMESYQIPCQTILSIKDIQF